MPSIVTHYYFGKEMLKLIPENEQWDRPCREAFLFGNQGPDPLFFSFSSKYSKIIRTMGFRIHDQHCTPALKVLLKRMNQDSPSARLRTAYQMGMLCHYTLDSNAHPYVHCFEKKLLESGVLKENYRFTHAMLETNIDVMLMHLHGKTVSEFSVPDVIHSDRRVDLAVAHLYSEFSRVFYHQRIPVSEFEKTFNNMRLTEKLLRSKHGIKRSLLSKVDKVALGDSFYGAMSHTENQVFLFDFINLTHQEWVDKRGVLVSSSFWELFQQALTEACGNLTRWKQGDPLETITANINFEGESEQR